MVRGGRGLILVPSVSPGKLMRQGRQYYKNEFQFRIVFAFLSECSECTVQDSLCGITAEGGGRKWKQTVRGRREGEDEGQQMMETVSLPKKQKTMVIMSNLPEEILMEILSRLPVKSLLRFRCVSKSWCNLIGDPQFIIQHFSHSQENNPALIFYDSSTSSLTVRYESSYKTGMFKFTPMRPRVSEIAVLGCCNGLVCLHISAVRPHLCIWNPATREVKYVPEANFDFSGPRHLFQGRRGFGFGFDSIHNDFKVVRIVHFYGKREVSLCLYSLSTGEWRELGKVSFIVNWEQKADSVTGVFVNGSVHWINSHVKAERGYIMSFDMALEKLLEIPEHDYGGKGQLFGKRLGELGGELSVIDTYWKYGEIWVMKDYGEKKSWIKMLTIPNLPSQVIEIQSNGEVLMDPLFKDRKSVMKRYVEFDPKSGTKRYIELGCLWYWPKVVSYVESLVPIRPTKEQKEQKEQKAKSKA